MKVLRYAIISTTAAVSLFSIPQIYSELSRRPNIIETNSQKSRKYCDFVKKTIQLDDTTGAIDLNRYEISFDSILDVQKQLCKLCNYLEKNLPEYQKLQQFHFEKIVKILSSNIVVNQNTNPYITDDINELNDAFISKYNAITLKVSLLETMKQKLEKFFVDEKSSSLNEFKGASIRFLLSRCDDCLKHWHQILNGSSAHSEKLNEIMLDFSRKLNDLKSKNLTFKNYLNSVAPNYANQPELINSFLINQLNNMVIENSYMKTELEHQKFEFEQNLQEKMNNEMEIYKQNLQTDFDHELEKFENEILDTYDEKVHIKAQALIHDEVEKKCSEYKSKLKLKNQKKNSQLKEHQELNQIKVMSKFLNLINNFGKNVSQSWKILENLIFQRKGFTTIFEITQLKSLLTDPNIHKDVKLLHLSKFISKHKHLSWIEHPLTMQYQPNYSLQNQLEILTKLKQHESFFNDKKIPYDFISKSFAFIFSKLLFKNDKLLTKNESNDPILKNMLTLHKIRRQVSQENYLEAYLLTENLVGNLRQELDNWIKELKARIEFDITFRILTCQLACQ